MRSITDWTYSTLVLYWLNEKENFRQIVGNRLSKIREKVFLNWCHIPNKEKPAEIGSRRSLIANISRVWREGPSWLPDKAKWPDQPFITSTTESEKETKCIRELVITAIQSNEIRISWSIIKVQVTQNLRILAWIRRFINNSKTLRNRVR